MPDAKAALADKIAEQEVIIAQLTEKKKAAKKALDELVNDYRNLDDKQATLED